MPGYGQLNDSPRFAEPMTRTTHISSVWRFATFLIVPHFVKIVLVQLPYKACEVAVLEVFG